MHGGGREEPLSRAQGPGLASRLRAPPAGEVALPGSPPRGRSQVPVAMPAAVQCSSPSPCLLRSANAHMCRARRRYRASSVHRDSGAGPFPCWLLGVRRGDGRVNGNVLTPKKRVALAGKASREVLRLLRHPRNETALFWPKARGSELRVNKEPCKPKPRACSRLAAEAWSQGPAAYAAPGASPASLLRTGSPGLATLQLSGDTASSTAGSTWFAGSKRRRLWRVSRLAIARPGGAAPSWPRLPAGVSCAEGGRAPDSSQPASATAWGLRGTAAASGLPLRSRREPLAGLSAPREEDSFAWTKAASRSACSESSLEGEKRDRARCRVCSQHTEVRSGGGR